MKSFRSTENITSRFSENAGRNGLHFQKLIREVIFSPVLSKKVKSSILYTVSAEAEDGYFPISAYKNGTDKYHFANINFYENWLVNEASSSLSTLIYIS